MTIQVKKGGVLGKMRFDMARTELFVYQSDRNQCLNVSIFNEKEERLCVDIS